MTNHDVGLHYCSPVTAILRSEPDYPPDSPSIMEFRLTYEGLLLGDKHPRPEHKQAVRREFHSQLAKLWKIHPALRRQRAACTIQMPELDPHMMGYEDYTRDCMTGYVRQRVLSSKRGSVSFPRPVGRGWFNIRGLSLTDYLADKFTVGNFNCVPLVRGELSLVTSIHVLFLRPAHPGAVLINSGDIDGRIKTLFDALQVPKPGQLKSGETPSDDEKPFFCLVEDDSLITHVAVETDTLLQPSGKAGNHPDNDCRLVLTVKIHAYEQHPGNEGIG